MADIYSSYQTRVFHHLISTYLTTQDHNPNSEDEQQNTDDDFAKNQFQ